MWKIKERYCVYKCTLTGLSCLNKNCIAKTNKKNEMNLTNIYKLLFYIKRGKYT